MDQMAPTGYYHIYFVLLTGKGLPLIETIVFAQNYWDKIQSSVIVFFKTYIQMFYCDSKLFILTQPVPNIPLK